MAKRQSRFITNSGVVERSQLVVRSKSAVQALQPSRNIKIMQLALFALVIGAFFWMNTAQANGHEATHVAMGDIGAIKSNLSDTGSSQVTWAQLTDEQRKVLSPLASEWDTLRPWQREKMLDIARDYPKMDGKKQERVQKRLNSWSRMTPYERENARQRYQQFHSLSPDKKDELRKKWAEHQKSKKDGSEVEYDPELD